MGRGRKEVGDGDRRRGERGNCGWYVKKIIKDKQKLSKAPNPIINMCLILKRKTNNSGPFPHNYVSTEYHSLKEVNCFLWIMVPIC